MIVGDNKRYLRVAFENEAEIESVVNDNAELLFGPRSLFLPKTIVRTLGGSGSIPDGIVIEFASLQWFVVEAELACHDLFGHIVPQVTKQLMAVARDETKKKILALALNELQKDEEFKIALVEQLKISEMAIHGKIASILEKQPVMALPIDEASPDLVEWSKRQHPVPKIWEVRKYVSVDRSDVLYLFPDFEDQIQPVGPDETTNSLRPHHSVRLSKLIQAGRLKNGEALTFEYAPRGKTKQKYVALVRAEGLEIDGEVFSPSTAAVYCMNKAGSRRKTEDGWKVWENSRGVLIGDLLEGLE